MDDLEPTAAALPDQAAPATSAWRSARAELLEWMRTLASAAVYVTLIITFVGQVARVDGQSMSPTLEDHDRLIVDKLAYRLHDPQIGDVVMLLNPPNPEQTFVKRIVAGPGDIIELVDGNLVRNGIRVVEDYVPADLRSGETRAAESVPASHYFVMGDHRNNSTDSRTFGFVPKKYILGKVQVRWWPLDRVRVFAP